MSDQKESSEMKVDHQCIKGYKWSDHHLNKFLENTTIAGLVYVFKSKSNIRRLVWGVLFLGAIVLNIITIGLSVKAFADRPTATTSTLNQNNKGLSFPAVTVCNVNKYNETMIDYERLAYHLFDPEQNFYLNENENISQQFCSANINNNGTIWEFLSAPEMKKNFIVYCGFSQGPNTELIRCEDEIQPVLTSAGVCYTFNDITNGKHNRIVTQTGIEYGLKLILSVDPANVAETSGVKVIVHQRRDIARPNLYGIGIPPGRSALIGIRKQIEIDQTRESMCTKGFPLKFLPNRVYSQFACRENAIVEHVVQSDACSCVIYPNPNFRSCSLNDSCCLLKEYTAYSYEQCPLPCRFTYYPYENSYVSFPTEYYRNKLERTFNKSFKGLVSAHIFFEVLHETSIVTYYSYDFVSFLSNIGGQMGLFLGISLISVIEIFVLILDELNSFCCPKKVKEAVTEIDEQLILPEIIDSVPENDKIETTT